MMVCAQAMVSGSAKHWTLVAFMMTTELFEGKTAKLLSRNLKVRTQKERSSAKCDREAQISDERMNSTKVLSKKPDVLETRI